LYLFPLSSYALLYISVSPHCPSSS
jgi:hypothetical protein